MRLFTKQIICSTNMFPPNKFCSTIPTVENVLNAMHFVKRNATHFVEPNATLRLQSACSNPNELWPMLFLWGPSHFSEDLVPQDSGKPGLVPCGIGKGRWMTGITTTLLHIHLLSFRTWNMSMLLIGNIERRFEPQAPNMWLSGG